MLDFIQEKISNLALIYLKKYFLKNIFLYLLIFEILTKFNKNKIKLF